MQKGNGLKIYLKMVMKLRFLLLLILSLVVNSGTVFGSIKDEKGIQIIAHRGASADAPEHTMAAYELAVNLGADYLEIDLGMTKDGHLIAIHDDTIDRTTNGKARVHSLTLSEIKQLDAGSWFNNKFPEKASPAYIGLPIPTVEEVFNHFGDSVNYYIEIKKPDEYPGMTDKLLHALSTHHLIGNKAHQGKVIIESFHSESLKYIHKKYPNLLLIQLGFSSKRMNLSKIASYANGVGPEFTTLDKEFIENAHKHDLLVHCWTVDNAVDIRKMIDLGVDGIFTNKVDQVKFGVWLTP